MIVEIFLFLGAAAFLFYLWATANYQEFEKRGVPYTKPVPFAGNIGGVVRGKISFQKLLMEYHLRTKSSKIAGFYNFRTPNFLINDPESIKKITVKDFEYFLNHNPPFNTNEPIVNGMLNMMKDQRWKRMRSTLTPVFTAAKMRAMFVLMNECVTECLDHLSEKSINGAGFDIELKEVLNRLSNDLTASAAFGLKVNSFKDCDNEFYTIGNAVAFFKGWQLFRFMFSNAAPFLFKLLGLKIFDADKTEYFLRLVIDTMNHREKHKIVRPDMIQLLMEARKESTEQWTDEEIVSQCFVFFFAGFESNTNLISTATYELARNPEVQQKLYEECQAVQDDLKGEQLSYDILQNMNYIDQVVTETMRKWPLNAGLDRLCAKDYTLYDNDNNKVFDFKTGDILLIPISGLHWNPEYFEHPEKFDPSRFSDENKDRIVPYTYMPFGIGPRNCIGSRYALMQAKAIIYYLVINFKFECSPKTTENLMDESTGFQLSPKNGYWLHLKPRNK